MSRDRDPVYLLDIAPLIALLWRTHIHNGRVPAWEVGKKLAVCPLTELGFLRISTQPSFGMTVAQARTTLENWKRVRQPAFVPCEISVMQTDPPSAGTKTTDFYLAGLADKLGMRLATLDTGISHKAAFVIP